MELKERIAAFHQLGERFAQIAQSTSGDGAIADQIPTANGIDFNTIISSYHLSNGWYTPASIRHRLLQLSAGLTIETLESWLSNYSFPKKLQEKTIGTIMAGNIPLVGFDDFAAVLLSGARFSGKLPSDDFRLMPLVAQMLVEIEPRFTDRIQFTQGRLSSFDAVIATGSNNSARYFDYYFGKYPHIIRRNRNGIAVLDGSETREELKALGNDIFLYFGLGCRSVSKLYVPQGYVFNTFFESIIDFGEELMNHTKYMNNYEYHKTLFLLGQIPLLDNNFVLLKEDKALASPPGVIHWEAYGDKAMLQQSLASSAEQIQCIVGHKNLHHDAQAFGTAQNTLPGDYADGIDTLKFLVSLVENTKVIS